MLNVAVLGAGYIGMIHLEAYRKICGARAVAVIDENEEAGQRAAEESGCSYFPSLEAALEKVKLDVADICLPTFLHERYTLAAAAAGLHVLCEKPVTLSAESFFRMKEACQAADVKFMVAQVVRWSPGYRYIAEKHAKGELGQLRAIYAKRLAQSPGWGGWHGDPNKSGGALFDMGAHDIDFLYSVLGMPKSVCATGWKGNTGCWDYVQATLNWQGFSALCEVSWSMTGEYPFSTELRLVGERGTAEFSITAGHNIKDAVPVPQLTYYPVGGEAEEVALPDTDAMAGEIQDFINAVRQNSQVPIPPAESGEVLGLILGVKRAMELGDMVVMREDECNG